jgi:ABC-2 type transport system permease protein
MNPQSNGASEPGYDSRANTGATLAATRPMYWSLRRELWENRSVYIALLAAGAVLAFGSVITLVGLPHRIRAAAALGPAHLHETVISHYEFAAGLLMATQILVCFSYSLGALHGERRDRSILFWKSLPVSDLTTVLSKATIPIVFVPLLTWAVTVVTQLIMLLASSAVVAGSGLSVASLWAQVSLFQMSLMLLYHLVTVHALWHAPIYGWLLMVSSWARRAVFLWAVLPPLAIVALEKLVFNSSHFAGLLMYRLTGGAEAIPMATGAMPIDPGTQFTLLRFLNSQGLWLGLLVTAAFLLAAARMRRYRSPI